MHFFWIFCIFPIAPAHIAQVFPGFQYLKKTVPALYYFIGKLSYRNGEMRCYEIGIYGTENAGKSANDPGYRRKHLAGNFPGDPVAGADTLHDGNDVRPARHGKGADIGISL